jgi:CO dehydrogenase maturation factor
MNKQKKIIAVVGKGGVGKTTISALIVKQLIAHRLEPILVVDADPNTGLDLALGVQISKTIGGIREEARDVVRDGATVSISKQELLELKIAESMVEAQYFDFIAMGRPEGPGCYCYANNVLKSTLAKLSQAYPYLVIDNEAGLENLSRRINPEVDLLIIVTDPSHQGLKTADRLIALAHEMGIVYNQLALIINRIRHDGLTQAMQDLRKKIKADEIIGVPEDPEIMERSESGQSIMDLPANNPTVILIDQFLTKIGYALK